MSLITYKDHKRIIKLWKSIGINSYWGDCLDVRFYLTSYLKKKNFNKLLDISSNFGIILSEANARMKIGLDYNGEYLLKSKAYFSTLKNICGSSEYLPFKDNSMDAIVLAHSLPGWDFPLDTYVEKNGEIARKALLVNMHRILKPHGMLYITTVNAKHVCYRDKEKANLDKILFYLDGLFYVKEIMGWNPLPILASLIPYRLFKNFPYIIKKFMFIPSTRMYSFLPGIWEILLSLSKIKSLNKHCRHLFIVCKKK